MTLKPALPTSEDFDMARDTTLEQQIETTLYHAGVHNSGELAEIIFEGLKDSASPLYQYEDENGTIWYGSDPEDLCDNFGCQLEDLVGGYFLPHKA